MNGKRIHQKFSYRVSYALLYPQRNFLLRWRKTCIVKFLTSMDAAGKQKLHRLAAGTVDSYIGKLRAIFNRLGRTGLSNPLAHSCVKEYLMFSVPLFYEISPV
ncbi:unnamed protein product [Porites lobata]|uniref:ALOG domain-containing protein n=1 Tax=Porites lobata TaxID=104759 RepID=A0ABN8SGD4_9CNID|nr:unnamed protein product [Porites lobata]